MTTEISSEYLALIERFPLRQLRSERDLKGAGRLVDELLDRDRSKDEDAYLGVLSILIEQYEDERHPIEPVRPREMLAYLIEVSGKSARRVALDTKIQTSTMSELLSGVREINVTHIRKLAPYFGVEPGTLIDYDEGTKH